MKKPFLFTISIVMLFSFFSEAQSTDIIIENSLSTRTMLKKGIVNEDKIEILDVTGVGSSAFSASNKADGSVGSYKHSIRITLNLLVAGSAKDIYQLVFYSPEEQIPFAATSYAGTTYVYYPISFYDGIKLKLDQSIAAKKKIQLKVTQKVDGFREALLIL